MNIQNSKKLIIFDLDGTLAESKSALDSEMSQLLGNLLKWKLVAVISGGSFSQFEKQFLRNLSLSDLILKNLYLLPTSGARFYTYTDNAWMLAYAHNLTDEEKINIIKAFNDSFFELNYEHPPNRYGELLEDRGTQITFSALGQSAPVHLKEAWNKEGDIRPQIKNILDRKLPQFEVRLGGLTSIDVTRKGVDKAFGVQQIEKHLTIPMSEMLFVGDALFEGGNDYPVKAIGVDTVAVTGPEETKKLIQSML